MIASGRPIDSIKTIAEEINSKKIFHSRKWSYYI